MKSLWVKALSVLIMAAFAQVSVAQEPVLHYHDEVSLLDSDTLIALPEPSKKASSRQIDIRYIPGGRSARAGEIADNIALVWNMKAPDDYWHASVRRVGGDDNDVFRGREFILEAAHRMGATDSLALSLVLDEKAFGAGERIALGLELTRAGARITGGNNRRSEIASIKETCDLSLPVGILNHGSNKVLYLVSGYVPDLAAVLATGYNADSLARAVAGRPAPEGVWSYLDRDISSPGSALGGRYRLAIVRNAEAGCYDIVYLGGAQVNAGAWKPGMKKGELRATVFEDNYDLVWYDSECSPIVNDGYADIEQGAILTVALPVQGAKIRFAKERPIQPE